MRTEDSLTTLASRFDAEQAWAALVGVLPRIASAIVVLFVIWLLLRLTAPLLRGALVRARFAAGLIDMIVDGLYRGTLVVLALITAASELGVNVAAALAGLGVAGIAVGFAAQETVANMIAGFLVFWDRPFSIGDYITTQDRYGCVTEITMRTTRIRTMENTFVVIPNKQIIGDMLVNHSMYGAIRINVPIGIAYKESIAHARAVLVPVLQQLPGVLAEPPVQVVAEGLGASSVDLQARVWIDDAAIERPIRFAVVEAAKGALDEAGIEIPFPHLQLFIEDIRDPAAQKLLALGRPAS